MVHEKIKDLRDTLVETKTENQSTHEIVKDIRDYLVGEKDELETTNEIVRDIRDELADTQVGITTAEMVKEIHDQIDDPAEAPQTIEEMLGDFQTSLSETETVSGNIVRFDNARALPFKKLNVNFQPKQDGTPWIQDAESEPYIQLAVSVERAGNHISDSVVGGTLAWNQLVKNVGETDTASGSIASFSDGADGAPMQSVVVTMTPQQDLHGQDAPYPAGGGKNIMHPVTVVSASEGLTVTNDNGKVTISGSAVSGSDIYLNFDPMTIQQGYIFAFMNSFTGATAYFLNNSTSVDYFSLGVANRVVNAESLTSLYGKEFNKLRILFTTNATLSNANLSPMVVLDGADTSTWSPYSNICPITGHDSGTVWGTGVNVWGGEQMADDIVSAINDGTYSKKGENTNGKYVTILGGWPSQSKVVFKEFKSDTRYTFILRFSKNNTNAYMNLRIYYTDGTYSNPNYGSAIDADTAYTAVIVTTSGKSIDRLESNWQSGEVSLYYEDCGVFEGVLTADDFTPYTGASYHSDFPSTVYGGTWEVTDGEIADKYGIVDLGTLNWGRLTNYNSFYAYLTGYKDNAGGSTISKPNAICSCYATGSLRNIYDGVDNTFSLGTSNNYNGRVLVNDSAYDNVTAFVQAITGQTLVYELATPTTLSVDPLAIPSQLGDNNVWSDAGETAVTYLKGTDTLTLKSGRKYLTRINSTDSMVSGSDQSLTVSRGVDNVFDLTQMFGTAVGDHFYNQGANYFRKYFGKDYYEYCAGELKSVEGLAAHETVGFNQWDEEWKNGRYNITTGEFIPGTGRMCCKNIIPVIPGATYYFKAPFSCFTVGFDAQQNCTGILYNQSAQTGMKNSLFDIPQNVRYIAWYTDSTSAYNHDICINISNPAKNGTYEPYVKHTYPLGNVTLRGIPKLSGNKWYYDGDIYKGSGSITRKYGVVDLGTLTWVYSTVGSISVFRQASLNNIQNTGANGVMSNGYSVQSRAANSLQDKDVALASTWWSSIRNIVIRDDDYTDPAEFKAAMSGVMLLYELAEPTTESAAKYTSVQIPGTVERYVTGSIVPVGHETRQMDIFPINGRNGVTVWGTGGNLLNIAQGAESYRGNGNLFTLTYGEDNSVTFTPTVAGSLVVVWKMFNATKSMVGKTISLGATVSGGVFRLVHSDTTDGELNNSGTYISNPYTFTDSDVGIAFGVRFTNNTGAVQTATKAIVSFGNTPSAFAPYTGASYHSDFPSTVYGGTIDYVNGVLTADRVIRTFASLATDKGWNKLPDVNQFYLRRPSALPDARYPFDPEERPISSVYKYSASGQQPSGTFRVSDALYIVDDRFDNVSDFRAALAEMDGGVVYYLAEPVIISIAPQKISAYLGSNTVWSDGDQVEVEYRSKPNRENQENS